MINEVGLEYAKALFDLANDLDSELENLQMLKVITEDEEIKKVLFHPLIDKDAKKEIFKNVLESKTSNIFLDYIYVLIDNDRLDGVTDIFDSFNFLYNKEKGILNVKITSKDNLSEEQDNKIIAFLKKKYQINQVNIEKIIDDTLIGGIKIYVGNDLLDATIDDQLLQIKESIE